MYLYVCTHIHKRVPNCSKPFAKIFWCLAIWSNLGKCFRIPFCMCACVRMCLLKDEPSFAGASSSSFLHKHIQPFEDLKSSISSWFSCVNDYLYLTDWVYYMHILSIAVPYQWFKFYTTMVDEVFYFYTHDQLFLISKFLQILQLYNVHQVLLPNSCIIKKKSFPLFYSQFVTMFTILIFFFFSGK